ALRPRERQGRERESGGLRPGRAGCRNLLRRAAVEQLLGFTPTHLALWYPVPRMFRRGLNKLIADAVICAVVFCLTARPLLNAANPESHARRTGSLAESL